MNKEIILECNNVSKSYTEATEELKILERVNFQIKTGDQIAILGRSGSGKTTLLQLLAGLDIPTTGDVKFLGKNWRKISEHERGVLRNYGIGFIYQLHHLLPEFTALENVAMPLLQRKYSISEIKDRAYNMLVKVGLGDRIEHKPAELSGGERQRVAIARALVGEPKCVLADEPTGNLDAENAKIIFDLIYKINKELHTTFIIVTHDLDLARKFAVKYKVIDGNLKLFD